MQICGASNISSDLANRLVAEFESQDLGLKVYLNLRTKSFIDSFGNWLYYGDLLKGVVKPSDKDEIENVRKTLGYVNPKGEPYIFYKKNATGNSIVLSSRKTDNSSIPCVVCNKDNTTLNVKEDGSIEVTVNDKLSVLPLVDILNGTINNIRGKVDSLSLSILDKWEMESGHRIGDTKFISYRDKSDAFTQQQIAINKYGKENVTDILETPIGKRKEHRYTIRKPSVASLSVALNIIPNTPNLYNYSSEFSIKEIKHSYKLLTKLFIGRYEERKDKSIIDIFKNQENPIKKLLINDLKDALDSRFNFELTDEELDEYEATNQQYRQYIGINSDQYDYWARLLFELEQKDSNLWSDFKNYMLREYSVVFEDDIDFFNEDGELLTELPAEWDDTKQFTKSQKSNVQRDIKWMIATSSQISENATFDKKTIADNEWIRNNSNVDTISGFAEPLDYNEVYNYLLQLMSKCHSKEQMLSLLYDMAYWHDKTLFPIYYQLVNNPDLLNSWDTTFYKPAPEHITNFIAFKGANVEVRTGVANRQSNGAYNVYHKWLSNIINNIKVGKSVISGDIAFTKSDLKNHEYIANTIVNKFAELGIDIPYKSVLYNLSKNNSIDYINNTYVKTYDWVKETLNTHIKEKNTDNIEFTEHKRLYDLADTTVMFRYNVSEGIYYNSKGNPIYSYQNPNGIIHFFNAINNRKEFEDKLLNVYAKIPKLQYSNLLWNTSTEDKPNGFLDFEYDDNGKKINIRVNGLFYERFKFQMNTGNKNVTTNVAQEYVDLFGLNWDLNQLILFNEGKFTLPSADGAVNYTLSIPVIYSNTSKPGKSATFADMELVTTRNVEGYFTDKLVQAVHNILNQEIQEHFAARDALFDVVDKNGVISLKPKAKFNPKNKTYDPSVLYLNKDWDGKSLLDKNGVPTGNVFKFLAFTIEVNGKTMNLPQYVDYIVSTNPEYANEFLLHNGVILNNTISPKVQGIIDSFITKFIKQEYESATSIYLPYGKLIASMTNKQNKPLFHTGFNKLMLNFALNKFIYNYEVGEMFVGSQNEFKPGKEFLDSTKRFGAQNRPGISTHTDVRFNELEIEDYSLPSPVLDNIRKYSPNNVDQYEEMKELSNAFSIMTVDTFKDITKAFGRYNMFKEQFDAIDRGELTHTQFQSLLNESQKFFEYVRSYEDSLYPRFISHQVKNSTFILIPGYMKMTQFEELYDFMKENNIGQISPVSAKKQGNKIPFSIVDKNGNFKVKLDDKTKQEINKYKREVSTLNIRIQQDFGSHIEDNNNTMSIQMYKHLFTNISMDEVFDFEGTELTGEHLFNMFHELDGVNVKQSAIRILEELKIKHTIEDGRIVLENNANIKEVAKLINDYLVGRTDNINLIYGARYDDKTTNTNFPLWFTTFSRKYQEVLLSRFTNRVTKQKLPGGHAAIIANTFFNDSTKFVREQYVSLSNMQTVKYVDSFEKQVQDGKRDRRLKAETTINGNTTVIKAEVLLSAWNKDFYEEGKLIDINSLDTDVRSMMGYRIPTEGKQSFIIFEVVGFLPQGTSQIVLPDELTVRAGLDYDIDSEYLIQYNIKKNKETGKWAKIRFETNPRVRYENYISKLAAKDISDLYNREVKHIIERNNIALKENLTEILKLKSIIKNIKEDTDDYNNIIDKVEDAYYTIDSIKDELEEINNQIADLYNSEEEGIDVTEQIEELQESKRSLTNQLDNANLVLSTVSSYLGYDPSNINISDIYNRKKEQYSKRESLFEELSNFRAKFKFDKQEIINDYEEMYPFKEFDKLPIAEQESKLARQNRMLDIIFAILSKPTVLNKEVRTPNSMNNIQTAVLYVDGLLQNNESSTNFLTIRGEQKSRNLVINVRNLKGDSVAYDGVMTIFQKVNAKISKSLGIKIKYDKADIPDIKIGTLYRVFGKDNVEDMGSYYMITDVNLFNNYVGTKTDMFGTMIMSNTKEVTSNILDAVKKRMGSNFNTHTLSMYKLLSGGALNFRLNDNNKIVDNKFLLAELVIHQPAIFDFVYENTELDSPFFKERSKFSIISRLRNKMLTDAYREIVSLYGKDTDFTKLYAFDYALEKGTVAFYDKEQESKIVSWFKSYGIDPFDKIPYNIEELKQGIEDNLNYNKLEKIDRIAAINYQLAMINNWEHYQNVTSAITTSIVTFNTDKLGAGPTLQVTDKLEANINKLSFDVKHIERQLRDVKGYSYELIKQMVSSLMTEDVTLDDIFAFCKKEGIDASVLNSNDEPVTLSVYPKFFGYNTRSSYPALENRLMYSNLLSRDVYSPLFADSIPVVKQYMESIDEVFKLNNDKETQNKIMSVIIANIVKSHASFVGLNDAKERERILGINMKTTPSVFELNEENFEKFMNMNLFNKLSIFMNNDIINQYINSYRGAHILSLLTIEYPSSINKLVRPIIKFETDVDVNDTIYSFMDMYYSTGDIITDYLNDVATDLIKYALLSEGLTFGRNFAKVVPLPILSNWGVNDHLYNANFEEHLPSFQNLAKALWFNEMLIPVGHKTVLRNKKTGEPFVSTFHPTFTPIPKTIGIIQEPIDKLHKIYNLKDKEFITVYNNTPKGLTKVLYKRVATDKFYYYHPINKTMTYETQDTVIPEYNSYYEESGDTFIKHDILSEEQYLTIIAGIEQKGIAVKQKNVKAIKPIGINISSNDHGLGAALTNPTHYNPKGKSAKEKGNLTDEFSYLDKGIEYEGTHYSDVEEAYQKNKAPYLEKKNTQELMYKLLSIKLKTYPQLVDKITEMGGITFLQNSTHKVKGDKFWESGEGNQDMFMKCLIQAYKNLNSPVKTNGIIALNIIEKWVQNGTANTTVRSNSWHEYNYKGDGTYTTKENNLVDIEYKGLVKIEGDNIVGTNISYTKDEFAKAEGFKSWNDFINNAKYAGVSLVQGESVHLYSIKKNEGTIKLSNYSSTKKGSQLDLFNNDSTPTQLMGKIVEKREAYGITFYQLKDSSYSNRTNLVISMSDVVIAIATDFTTAGEKATLGSANTNKVPYFKYDIITANEVAQKIVEDLNSKFGNKALTLNFAGNGIYALSKKYKGGQDAMNRYAALVFQNILENKNRTFGISDVITGGQTGIDEAFAIAARNNNIPTTVVMPLNNAYRINFNNKDGYKDMNTASTKKQSIDRFKNTNPSLSISISSSEIVSNGIQANDKCH